MRTEEIQVGHIYYVNFEPHKQGEFPDQHLALVIRKNHENITFIVVPLTGSNKYADKNKVPLGKISTLPKHLSGKESYAVIDQVRTLSFTRFSRLHEKGKVVDTVLEPAKFREVIEAVINNMLDVFDDEQRTSIIKDLLDKK